MKIQVKSILRPPHKQDGKRYLIETFWPEGVETYHLAPYEWPREALAPSYELNNRALYENWPEAAFKERYRAELGAAEKNPWIEKLLREAETSGVTLMYAPKTLMYAPKTLMYLNKPGTAPAEVLKEFLEEAAARSSASVHYLTSAEAESKAA